MRPLITCCVLSLLCLGPLACGSHYYSDYGYDDGYRYGFAEHRDYRHGRHHRHHRHHYQRDRYHHASRYDGHHGHRHHGDRHHGDRHHGDRHGWRDGHGRH